MVKTRNWMYPLTIGNGKRTKPRTIKVTKDLERIEHTLAASGNRTQCLYFTNKTSGRSGASSSVREMEEYLNVINALKNSNRLKHWDKPPKDFGPNNPEVRML